MNIKKGKWSCFKLHVHINATITLIAVLNSGMSLLYAYRSDFNKHAATSGQTC